MSKFTRPQQTDEFYQEHKGKPFFADLSAFMQSDVVTGMELVAENAVQNFRNLLGPTDSKAAPKNTLRGIFGTDGMSNAVLASASASDYNRESSIFFGKSFGTTAAFNNCTCCTIKPHIVADGLAG